PNNIVAGGGNGDAQTAEDLGDLIAIDVEDIERRGERLGEMRTQFPPEFGVCFGTHPVRLVHADVRDHRPKPPEGGAEVFAHPGGLEGMAHQDGVQRRIQRQRRPPESGAPSVWEHHAVEGILDGFEIPVSKALIRFQMVPLGPLVPSVQEHDALIAVVLRPRIVDHSLEPRLKGPRRRAMDDEGMVSLARGVVPGWHDGPEANVTWQLRTRVPQYQIPVAADPPGKLWVEELSGHRRAGGVPAPVRRELDRSITPIRRRRFGFGAESERCARPLLAALRLHTGQVNVTDPGPLGRGPPDGGGAPHVRKLVDAVDEKERPAVDPDVV